VIKYHWQLITDQYLDGVSFAISPITGHLFEVTHKRDICRSVLFKLFFGFNTASYTSSSSLPIKAPINVPPVSTTEYVNIRYVRASRWIIESLLSIVPLGLVVGIISCLNSVKGSNVDFNDALSFVAHAFGSRSDGNCLQVAVCRYWLLRKLGWRTELHLGVLFPTENMHAWVVYNGQPLLECPDFISHYQSAVAYHG
jgi:hypothetical protein